MTAKSARLASMVACGAGIALLALLVVSAVRFAMLPTRAIDASELGWTVPLGGAPLHVILDADGRTAWVVYDSSACRVRTRDGRALRCDALPVRAAEFRDHVHAGDRLFLLSWRERDQAATMRAIVLRDDAGPPVDTGWQPVHLRKPLFGTFNAGYNTRLGRVEIYASDDVIDTPFGALFAVPVSLDGIVGEPERLALDLGAAVRAHMLPHAIAPDPPAAIVTTSSGDGASWLRADGITAIDLGPRGCSNAALDCVVAASGTMYSRYRAPPVLWMDPIGDVQTGPLAEGSSNASWRYAVVERRDAARNGGERLVLAAFPSDKETVVVPVPGGERIELRVDGHALDSVLAARRGGGPWRRLAIEAWNVDDVSPIPHDDGVLLLSSGYGGRVVALDRDLRRVDPAPAFFARIGQVIARRAQYALLQVALFLAGLVVLPLLVASCARRLRAGAPPQLARTVVALVTCDLAIAWLYAKEWSHLFP